MRLITYYTYNMFWRDCARHATINNALEETIKCLAPPS